jgi:hypothetical protein
MVSADHPSLTLLMISEFWVSVCGMIPYRVCDLVNSDRTVCFEYNNNQQKALNIVLQNVKILRFTRNSLIMRRINFGFCIGTSENPVYFAAK